MPRGSISKEVQGVSESFGEASELQGAPEIQQAPEIHREPQREEMCIFVACSIIMELSSFVLLDWPLAPSTICLRRHFCTRTCASQCALWTFCADEGARAR